MNYKFLSQDATSTDPLIGEISQLPDSDCLLASLRQPKPVEHIVIENFEISDTSDSFVQLEQALQLVQKRLQSFATASDVNLKMQVAFGKGINAADLTQAWATGDFSAIPKIEIRPASEINGADGAFAAATDKIYLAQEFLNQNTDNPEAVVDVLLEEIGHFVASQPNELDACGDEGAIFADLVQARIGSSAILMLLVILRLKIRYNS